MLAIEVAFLTGRSVATAYNSRQESEWPPHPARLFSALVATHCTAPLDQQDQRDAERRALEWLETQRPPAIAAGEARAREVVTVFVPVNDVALTDVDAEAAAVDAARAAHADATAGGKAAAVKSSASAMKKAEERLRRAIVAATSVPSRAQNPARAAHVLPEGRVRQPRTFPSMTPDSSRVTYVWSDAEPTAEQRETLDRLLRRLVRVGHSSSFVAARLVITPPVPTWRPRTDGQHTLRAVGPGQLAALEALFERHREEEPRVMPFVPVAYTTAPESATTEVASSVWSDDWLVLRKVSATFLPMTASAGIARSVRRTLMSFADEPIVEVLSGHRPDGHHSEQPHLAVVPLPFVGHPNASGGIIGVALVLPLTVAQAERAAVYRAVAGWEAKYRADDEDTPQVKMNLGSAGEVFFERIKWDQVQVSLRASTWSGPARVWSSVTPVALDRNPGDLRSTDSRKGAEAIDEARDTVRTACERIGLPAPSMIEVLPAAPWAGAAKARHYPAFPGDAGRTQRVLTHVRVEFNEAIRGPILLGAGRYVGLGLLRPEVQP